MKPKKQYNPIKHLVVIQFIIDNGTNQLNYIAMIQSKAIQNEIKEMKSVTIKTPGRSLSATHYAFIFFSIMTIISIIVA